MNDRIDAEPRRAAVRVAFARLSAKEQDVVSLCVIQGMTNADAASALGIPAGTVKSRLARAKTGAHGDGRGEQRPGLL